MENIIIANEQLNEWCSTQGINYYEGDAALGFLFKYAVPKARNVIKKQCNQRDSCYSTKSYTRLFFNKWLDKVLLRGDDPALALFWCIFSIIDKDTP